MKSKYIIYTPAELLSSCSKYSISDYDKTKLVDIVCDCTLRLGVNANPTLEGTLWSKIQLWNEIDVRTAMIGVFIVYL